ncbi:hypothetical protein GF340_05420 [Candidatus Peregrinibacteria bacterium]|nr:hypothetical protein [Candidatus Peregrinibacteria bacterium]
MSNKELYEKCRAYGQAALEARRKFIGLLPEVARRRLWQEKGFESLYHFAAVLAGVSRDQVQRVLQLEKRFEDKPVLKKVLVKGEISVNKLARVASIATEQNQTELVHMTKNLSTRSLEQAVKEHKSVHVQRFEMADDIKQKLQKLFEEGIDVNEMLRNMLNQRDKQIEENNKLQEPAKSSYIPVKIRRAINYKYGNKCAVPNCQQKSTNIHHTLRRAIGKIHSPKFMVPLCKAHHDLEHLTDERVMMHRKLLTK